MLLSLTHPLEAQEAELQPLPAQLASSALIPFFTPCSVALAEPHCRAQPTSVCIITIEAQSFESTDLLLNLGL